MAAVAEQATQRTQRVAPILIDSPLGEVQIEQMQNLGRPFVAGNPLFVLA